jgi:hypothetical protein
VQKAIRRGDHLWKHWNDDASLAQKVFQWEDVAVAVLVVVLGRDDPNVEVFFHQRFQRQSHVPFA